MKAVIILNNSDAYNGLFFDDKVPLKIWKNLRSLGKPGASYRKIEEALKNFLESAKLVKHGWRYRGKKKLHFFDFRMREVKVGLNTWLRD